MACVAPAFAESIREKTDRKMADIPNCGRNLGTIAIREPDHNWWGELNLASPEVLLKVFVRKSGCFTLVDRGKGFEMAQEERQLASGGDLQQGSNIGKGQVKAADYILVPDIASKNNDASGTNIGGILGGFVGGGAGALLSNISISSKTADVVLSIVNVRTSEDGPIEQGPRFQDRCRLRRRRRLGQLGRLRRRGGVELHQHRYRPGRDACLHRCLHQARQRHGRHAYGGGRRSVGAGAGTGRHDDPRGPHVHRRRRRQAKSCVRSAPA